MYNAVIIKHSLPQIRLEVISRSKNNGSCTNVSISSDRNPVCAGRSVLNDGIIPPLAGVNSNPELLWASELFALNGTHGRIVLSFEVDSENHNCMELAVFNCPDMGINLPLFSVYFDNSFRPDRESGNNEILGTLIVMSQLVNTSCNRLLVLLCFYYLLDYPLIFTYNALSEVDMISDFELFAFKYLVLKHSKYQIVHSKIFLSDDQVLLVVIKSILISITCYTGIFER